jgi:hypothetical protein
LHEDVEGAEDLDGGRHGVLDIGRPGDVRFDEARRPAETVGRSLAGRCLLIGHQHFGALRHETGGNALADPARGAEHEGGPAFQPAGHQASLFRIASFTVSSRTAANTIAPRIIWV